MRFRKISTGWRRNGKKPIRASSSCRGNWMTSKGFLGSHQSREDFERKVEGGSNSGEGNRGVFVVVKVIHLFFVCREIRQQQEEREEILQQANPDTRSALRRFRFENESIIGQEHRERESTFLLLLIRYTFSVSLFKIVTHFRLIQFWKKMKKLSKISSGDFFSHLDEWCVVF